MNWFNEWFLEWKGIFQNMYAIFKTYELPRLEAVVRDILKYYNAGDVVDLFKAIVGIFEVLGEFGLLLGYFFIWESAKLIIELIKHIIGY